MTDRKKGKKPPRTVREGYRRLAFGPVGDAVRLAFWEEGDALDPTGLDLYNVSEIRRVKGGVEVRFYDRLDALDRLTQLDREERREGQGLFDALRQGAQALRDAPGGEDGGEDGV